MGRRTARGGTSRRLACLAVFALLTAAFVARAPASVRAGLTCDPGLQCAQLFLVASGLGAGTVTGHGISCSIDDGVKTGDCTQEFNFPGDYLVVELTMTAAPGSVYLKSTGGTYGPGVPVVENVLLLPDDENWQSKEAIFNLGWQTITLGLAGAGSGVIRHTEEGVTCPSYCEATFEWGDGGIQFIADPDPGSYFKSWSGPCAGQGAHCQLEKMPKSTTMTVTFGLTPAATATPKPATPKPTVAASVSPTVAPSIGPLPSAVPPSTAPAGSAIPSGTSAPSDGAIATTSPSAEPVAPVSSDAGFGSGLLIGLLIAAIVGVAGGFLLWRRRAPASP